MYQSYLLLRNNEQSGPYSLEQLIQLELKPFDLVWEEGRSSAWRYPAEIESLQAFMEQSAPAAQSIVSDHSFSPANTTAIPKKVFVSMPGKKSAPPVQVIEEPVSITTSRIAPLPFSNPAYERNEPAYSYFQKTNRKSKISSKQVLLVSGVCLALVISWILYSKDDVPLPDVKPPATILSSIPTPTPVENEANLPVPSLPEKSKPELLVRKDVVPPKKTRVNQPAKSEPLPETELAITTTLPPPVIEKKETVNENEAGIPVDEQPAPKKEKKKFREVVRNIFSPKEKEADETPLPATGRKASKRSNTGEVIYATEAVRNNIDISSNDKGNWMMGISGMKVTVRNRNNLPLASVVITISYFDVNNKLLEKKDLNFKNLTANGKMTLNAPEHRWADHTEISLGAVEMERDAYAMDR